jgi:hypothetical protein
MTDTQNLRLPLLQPAQAQKHVTVNEALARLDGLTQLSLVSRQVGTPPAIAVDGQSYLVPFGAVNAWSGQIGAVAIFANGGWVFVPPQSGWRAWVRDEGQTLVFDGAAWQSGVLASSVSGAAARFDVIEFDHEIVAGGAHMTLTAIPANSMVFGVTGRVVDELTGTMTDWQLGISGSTNKFGSGLGTGVGSYVLGMLSAPDTIYGALPLLLTPDGGDFSSGTVRLCVHVFSMTLPGV